MSRRERRLLLWIVIGMVIVALVAVIAVARINTQSDYESARATIDAAIESP